MAKEIFNLLSLLNRYKVEDPNLFNILKAIIERIGFDSLDFDGIALPANSRAQKGRLLFDRFHVKFQHSENNRDFVDVQPHERARVYNNADIIVPNNALTALTFNTIRYDCLDDTDRLYLPTLTSRFTARWQGNYSIGANIVWQASAVGIRTLGLRINGTTRIVQAVDTSPLAGGTTELCVNTDYEMNPTDYVEVVVFQNTGGALLVEVHANWSPEFWIRRNN